MKIVYTKHALEKLNTPDAKLLKITKSKIESALDNPIATSKLISRTGKLDT